VPTPLPSDSAPDEELLLQIAAGQAQALVMLFRRRRREVHRFATHMTGSPSTADDVTQDVFLTVLREAASYDGRRGTVIAWLMGITRNLVRRRLARDRWCGRWTRQVCGRTADQPSDSTRWTTSSAPRA
jgi:RNA polymerase sigma factor (sigma-70 family)